MGLAPLSRQLGHAKERIVFNRGQRYSDNIQIGCRVLFQIGGDDAGKAEHLCKPGAHLFCHGVGLASFDTLDDFKQMPPCHVVDGERPQQGQNIVVKTAADLRERTLPDVRQDNGPMSQPLLEDSREGVVAGQAHGPLLQLAFDMRVDALGKLCACFVALCARLLLRHVRIAAERNAVLLACPVVAEMPGTSACDGDPQAQAERVARS